jgi:hypothetical protein
MPKEHKLNKKTINGKLGKINLLLSTLAYMLLFSGHQIQDQIEGAAAKKEMQRK